MNMKMKMKVMMIRKKNLQIHVTSVSGLCVHFTFKICQIVAGTSMIRQIHEISSACVSYLVVWLLILSKFKNIKIELVDEYDD